MRQWILAVAVATTLLAAPAAFAAPTCQDINGLTIKCGTPGAMPVGWTPSPQQLLERELSRPMSPSANQLLELICAVGLLFALIALMPDFDGSRAGDWDEQEGDHDDRR